MFIVMRTRSPKPSTEKIQWEVASRPFARREHADQWREFLQEELVQENPRSTHRFIVIEADPGG